MHGIWTRQIFMATSRYFKHAACSSCTKFVGCKPVCSIALLSGAGLLSYTSFTNCESKLTVCNLGKGKDVRLVHRVPIEEQRAATAAAAAAAGSVAIACAATASTSAASASAPAAAATAGNSAVAAMPNLLVAKMPNLLLAKATALKSAEATMPTVAAAMPTAAAANPLCFVVFGVILVCVAYNVYAGCSQLAPSTTAKCIRFNLKPVIQVAGGSVGTVQKSYRRQTTESWSSGTQFTHSDKLIKEVTDTLKAAASVNVSAGIGSNLSLERAAHNLIDQAKTLASKADEGSDQVSAEEITISIDLESPCFIYLAVATITFDDGSTKTLEHQTVIQSDVELVDMPKTYQVH